MAAIMRDYDWCGGSARIYSCAKQCRCATCKSIRLGVGSHTLGLNNAETCRAAGAAHQRFPLRRLRRLPRKDG